MQTFARYLELAGSNYEIGCGTGKFVSELEPLKAHHASGWQKLPEEDFTKAKALFERWCPGLNAEIEGFADTLRVHPSAVTYYAMTYLRPRCAQIAILPPMTQNGHVLLARSYEFNHKAEDFTLARTCLQGKYTHIGSTVMLFGRDEGINEHGLAVSMSSCGFPVGTPEGMRGPAIPGLQFWAVIRALLENCRDTQEALSYLKEMPIGYNINLILADRAAHAALFETLDGRKAFREIDENSKQPFLYATNHVMLPELKPFEPGVMLHSSERVKTIERFIKPGCVYSEEDLKRLLLSAPLEGLAFHDYENYFGTTKSVVMDATDIKTSLCWGGLPLNGWQSFEVAKPMAGHTQQIELVQENAPEGFYNFI